MIIFHKLQAGHVQDKHPEKFTKVWTQTKKTTAWVHHNHFSRIWHTYNYIYICVYFIVRICIIYVQLCYSKTCVFPTFSYQMRTRRERNHGSSWILKATPHEILVDSFPYSLTVWIRSSFPITR